MPLVLTRRISFFFGYGERLTFLYGELPAYQRSLLATVSGQRLALRLVFRRYIIRWPEDGQRALRSAGLRVNRPSSVQVTVLTSVSIQPFILHGEDP